MIVLRYLKARLREQSTWMFIATGIGTAALLPWPWSLVSAVVHVAAALVPDKGGE